MIAIAGRTFSEAHGLIIGEVAQAHDGSLGMAHAFIDAIANAGADAVKFQTHIASAETTAAEPWRVRFSTQDATRYAYWQRMEFSPLQWRELKAHADDRELIFLSSPFSIEAVDLLTDIGVAAWKIASGEVRTLPMLERIAATRLPVLLSSGMSSMADIDATMEVLAARGVPVALMQCTTAYPCPPEKVGLNMIPEYRERYGCPVGLSDHSGTIYPALAAATIGAEIFEVHVTLSREMFGPDVASSVTTSELRQLVDGIRFIEAMRNSPVDKDGIAAELTDVRQIFMKSVVAVRDLAAGTVLTEQDLAFKKPGHGIPAHRWRELVGRRLRAAVARDQPVPEAFLS